MVAVSLDLLLSALHSDWLSLQVSAGFWSLLVHSHNIAANIAAFSLSYEDVMGRLCLDMAWNTFGSSTVPVVQTATYPP